MRTTIHFFRLLTIVVWVGGLIIFAFVLAPVAFHLLTSTHVAGIVVGGTLRVLHIIGLVCGSVFLVATAILRPSFSQSRSRYTTEMILAFAMLLTTAYLQFSVLPAMEQDRLEAGGNIESSPFASPSRLHFEQLHRQSERVEGAVLFCGLGIVVLMAGERLPPEAVNS